MCNSAILSNTSKLYLCHTSTMKVLLSKRILIETLDKKTVT